MKAIVDCARRSHLAEYSAKSPGSIIASQDRS
jgi:hypothetical protein